MSKYWDLVNSLTPKDVIELMKTLGAQLIDEKTDVLIFNTICHHSNESDGSPKLWYYKDSHRFMCWTECGSMNMTEFLEHYYETRGLTYDWYQDIFLLIKNYGNVNTFQEGFDIEKYHSNRLEYEIKKPQKLSIYSENVLAAFEKIYPQDWLKEGISKETIDKYNILFSISQNKIIIPHYDVKGNLVGIRGRAEDEYEIENLGKYMPVQIEGTWYSHPLSLNLYGLNITLEAIKRTGFCILFEGEKSVLKMDTYYGNNNNAVAVCGSNFNKFQLKLLMMYAHPQEIIIAFDNEEQQNQHSYYDKLSEICKKYNNYAKFSFIYDRKSLTDKKDSPVDKGKEIFETLLLNRIKRY